MSIPGVKSATLQIYEKSGRHHHDNDIADGIADAEMSTLFIAVPEHLGVRIRIASEVSRASLTADVAIIYKWDRLATPEDDLDSFAAETALPQVLSCASTLLIDLAGTVGAKAPFYGVAELDRVISTFRQRTTTLSELLVKSQGPSPKPRPRRQRRPKGE